MQVHKGRILCVDDNKDTCDMLTVLLGLEGYEVIQASNVADGLSAAMSDDFDLIVLDWVLKDGSGLELCKQISGFNSKAPILFYSGLAGKHEMEAAMRAGAHGFLVKPLDVEDLLRSVSRCVGEGEQRQASNSETLRQ
jgi:DNA-binding response OmpR family regulator